MVISPFIDEFKYFFISLASWYFSSRYIILQTAASIVMSYLSAGLVTAHFYSPTLTLGDVVYDDAFLGGFFNFF